MSTNPPPEPGGGSRKLRWLLGTAVGLGLLTGGFFFFQYRIVDIQLKPLIENELSQAVHSPVLIGSVRAGLTGNVVLTNVSLKVPGSPWESHLTVDRVSIGLDLFSLLFHRKTLENCLESISFLRPQIILARNLTTAANLGQTVVSIPITGAVQAPIPIIPIPKIIIQEGSFYIQAEKSPRLVLNQLKFQANKMGDAWSLSLNAHSPQAGSTGIVRFDGSFRIDPLKVSGKALLNQWPVASASSSLKETTGWELSEGTIDAESPLVIQLGHNIWFDAKANVNQVTLKSPEPAGIAFSKISGRAFLRPTEISVPGDILFQVGQTTWHASGFLPFDGRPLSVHTTTNQLYLSSVFDEILKLKKWKTGGMGSAALDVTGSFSEPIVEGTAQLGPSSVEDWQLDSLSIKAGYEKGVVQLFEAAGKLYDGEFSADGFMPISGDPAAPVSLRVVLKNVDAKKIKGVFGLSGLQGNSEIHVGGSLDKPVISSDSQLVLKRSLHNNIFEYSIHNMVEMKDQKLTISTIINDKARLEGELLEKNDYWELGKLFLIVGKKNEKLTGKGTWPNKDDQPIDIQIQGKNISIQDLPFLQDQFPQVSGKVQLSAQISGTRIDPKVFINLSSPAVQAEVGKQSGSQILKFPLEVHLAWDSGVLNFQQMSWGEIFSIQGQMGLMPDSLLDMKIHAKGVPIGLLTEIMDWNNPPQPFEGSLTGDIHLTGVRKNPIVEGSGKIDKLKVGDWWADQVEAKLNLDQGKYQIKEFKVSQTDHTLTAQGSWDNSAVPGTMNMVITADGFQLGMGPKVSGVFHWSAQTGDPWWNCNGTLASDTFSLTDLNKNTRKFNDLIAEASYGDSVLKGKLKVGKSIHGSAILDASVSPIQIGATLKIEPVLVSEVPELSQFLPPSLKVTGKLSGELNLKKGDFDTLPIDGSFLVMNGSIQKYDFDRMEFQFKGNKRKISPSFLLERDQATYKLSGSLESPGAIWDSACQIKLNGPIHNEKLQNITALLGVDVEKHKVGGEVNGNLVVGGALYNPVVDFSLTGNDLQFDNYNVPSADIHFSEEAGKITIEKTNITLSKGEINLDGGSLQLDPQDSTLVNIDLLGTTQDLPIAVFNLSKQIHLSGKLALEDKEERPTFDGKVSIIEPAVGNRISTPFDVSLSVHKKRIIFKPIDTDQPQLIGNLDFSQEGKIAFENLHLTHSSGSFSIDGVLDLSGPCHLESDAKDVPIEEIGKWISPDFPLSGMGDYHLVFDGTLDDPLFTASISVSNGKIQNLGFDLLSGDFRAKNNVLMLGDETNPISLSQAGHFKFNLHGKMPLGLTKESWLRVHDKEMDISADMEKGDFGIILLAGLAKKASGDMDFSAHVTGTLDSPMLNLDLDLKNCQLVPPIAAQLIDDMSGRIKVRNNVLAVQDLNGRIGQGRVFISSPPVEQSKMVLVNFIPQYLDFQVKTIGQHGLWLSIPTIMKKGEWGEIYFYGATPTDPMLIQGSLDEPHVIGTALLDTGHYTFPPVEAKDESGQKIEYRELAGVYFQLHLKSGKDTWYSNDFNSQFLELKVDPGDEIYLEGKDSDRTPEQAGIKCAGEAGSKQGFLRYLGHEFKLEEASLFIPKGKLPTMEGKATDRLLNVEVPTAGGVRTTDMDIWVVFNGTFGKINFTLDSSPRFSMTDPDIQQKLLLSYIMFGRDMTGYTAQQLQQYYQQNMGLVATDVFLQYIDRISSSWSTELLRPYVQQIAGINLTVKSNLATNSNNSSAGVSVGEPSQMPQEAIGNTLVGALPLVQLKLNKPLDQRLSLVSVFGVNRDLGTGNPGFQSQLGFQYDFSKNLSLTGMTGQNDVGLQETTVGIELHQPLPNIMEPKKDDTEKPRFERFDVYPIGKGKFQINWQTDKVTRCEVQVLDENEQVVQDHVENGQADYYHQLEVDNLDPDKNYEIQILAKDLNQNQAIKVEKVSAESD